MIKGKSKFKESLLALPILLLLMCGSAFAQVSVYAEGAYTDSELKVYIYADVTQEPIISFGVKLTYDDNEVSLGDDCLERNDDVWYFGDPDGTTYEATSAGPVVTAEGPSSNVVFVGGKIDSTVTPQTGVGVGDRILLGIVTFSRNTEEVPTIGLALGKGGDYENFVELDGGLLDSTAVITESVEIHARGDANGDGRFTGRDINKIKSYFSELYAPCWVDCNDDGRITGRDINCLKAKF